MGVLLGRRARTPAGRAREEIKRMIYHRVFEKSINPFPGLKPGVFQGLILSGALFPI
jgi:hypothetical protein